MQILKLHLHSMIAHVVAAMVPVGAAAWLLASTGTHVGHLDPGFWQTLTIVCLATVFVFSVPLAITGVGERNLMYARWHRTHRIKLLLSSALTVSVGGELFALIGTPWTASMISWLGFLIVIGNIVLTFGLVALGLKITVGNLSVSRTSYTPDGSLDPPVDILEQNAVFAMELPKNIDPLREE
jgi:hypothetical protein